MAYEIRYSDFVNKGSIVIEDQTINQDTSLDLPGRNTTAYGASIASNFLHLLENFANSTQPVNPVEGQLWYDNTPGVDQLKLWDGTTWVAAGGLKKSNLPPEAANSIIGDLWVDTDNSQLYLFAGSGWVLVGPEFAEGLATGTRPSKVTAIDNNEYDVIFIEVKGKTLGVVASEAFTPKSAIEGFPSGIRPGVNLSASNLEGDGVPQFNGISEKSLNLVMPGNTSATDVLITAANVMRKDAENITNWPIRIKNTNGVNVGISNELKLYVDGFSGVLQHDISGSNLQIRMNNAGTTSTVITVDSTQKVGINNPSPQYELDVEGTIQTNEQIRISSLTESTGVSSGSFITSGGAGIAKNLNVGGIADINGPLVVGKPNLINPDTGAVNPVSAAILPDSNNLRSIGQPDKTFSAVYATEFVGSLRGDVQGSVSGRAGLADRLSSPTVFQMAGDVTANNITFDGQQGTVTFNTAIDSSFIAGAAATTGVGSDATPVQSDADDLFLVYKGDAGLFQMPRDRILGGIKAIVPVGTIIPYAGITDDVAIDLPTGWLVCDGSNYLKSAYRPLFEAIQYSFKPQADVDTEEGVPDLYFSVPDMRGRFPLGNDSMGKRGSANVVDVDAADQHGGKSGVQRVTLSITNLPEHEHDMVNDRAGQEAGGSQFYAFSPTSTVQNLAADHTIEDTDLVGTGSGALYAGTGGILSQSQVGQPFNILNPFVTLNYLIYAGEANA
jgi:microcystin-dependent protein